MKSIITTKKKCYICGSTYNLHTHHCLFGKNREKADKYGLTVVLCQEHHEGACGVHGKHGHRLDIALKCLAQSAFVRRYGQELWDKEFGRNYLDEP